MSHKFLVTGCTSFVGRHLVTALRESITAPQIIGTSRHRHAPDALGLDAHFVADLQDGVQVRDLIKRVRPTAVFHLASQRSGDLAACLATNVGGTAHLLDALREEFGTSVRVVVVGSAAEIGFCERDDLPLSEKISLRPVDAYGLSKVAQSLWAQAQWLRFEQPVVRMRLFNLIGPDVPDALLPGRCARLLAEQVGARCQTPLEFGDLWTERDYTDVRDVARALVLGWERGQAGQVYHVGSGRAATGRFVVDSLVSIAHSMVGHVEVREVVSGKAGVPVQVADASRARRELGWEAHISLEESLRELWHSASKRASIG